MIIYIKTKILIGLQKKNKNKAKQRKKETHVENRTKKEKKKKDMLDLEKETPVRTLSPPQSSNNYYLKALNLTSL